MSAPAPDAPGAPLVVASHPDHHPYVDHIRPLGGGGPAWLDTGDAFWDPARLAARGVDLAHLHFGFELVPRPRLRAWAEGLRRHGIALVHTIHDLDNPHLVDQTGFHALVRELVEQADELVTLTGGAAAAVAGWSGRRPTVVPHPHIVTRRLTGGPPRAVAGWANLGALRPNLDLDVVIEAAHAFASAQAGPFRLHVEPHVLDGASAPVRRALRTLAAVPGTDLVVEAWCSDEELWQRLSTTRIVLLPYHWGTHSGMLEAARDCGAVAIGPSDVGCYVEQGAEGYGPGRPVAEAIGAVLAAPHPEPVARGLTAARLEQRAAIAAAHEQVYRRAVARLR